MPTDTATRHTPTPGPGRYGSWRNTVVGGVAIVTAAGTPVGHRGGWFQRPGRFPSARGGEGMALRLAT